jgi:hypothetical protein
MRRETVSLRIILGTCCTYEELLWCSYSWFFASLLLVLSRLQESKLCHPDLSATNLQVYFVLATYLYVYFVLGYWFCIGLVVLYRSSCFVPDGFYCNGCENSRPIIKY